jgi:hypothetical protein
MTDWLFLAHITDTDILHQLHNWEAICIHIVFKCEIPPLRSIEHHWLDYGGIDWVTEESDFHLFVRLGFSFKQPASIVTPIA